jgi:glycosyltransferase involved in cell wall biosynthesis
MNILLINTFYYPDIIGGAEISVQKLAEGLAVKGHEVNVLCTSVEDAQEIINGVNVTRIKINNLYQPIEYKRKNKIVKLMYHTIDIYNVLNRKKITNIIDRLKPDIIHVNNLYGISPLIWTIAYSKKIPIIQTLRDYYLMCPRVNLLRKDKKVCTKPPLFCKIYRELYKKLSWKIDIVTAPSEFTLDLFTNEGYFMKAKKQKIFNAIDFDNVVVEKYYLEKRNGLNNCKKIKFVFMGSLEYHKGIHLLLKGFNNIKNDDIELHIAGKGSLEYLVKEYADNDNRIKYYGFITGAEKDNLLSQCNVLIVPSIWYEPFGRVVIDAYKYAMPVIGSCIGGIKEIIEHEKTGKLIKLNCEDEISDAITYFAYKDNINKMLENCFKKLKQFSIQEQIASFEKIYMSVL